ncbi:MAG: SGNH/GDSL hydrolase family protein [Reichenbachiella sp.]|uniref:SGNH/GDSL hydrolase family protein n=1 Tax=Reichenbachiella sp. TaxID=2184521 RepID=UPI00326311E1
MNLKYLIGLILATPLLPLMYYQGRRIRASIPQLPEAKEPCGESVHNGSDRLINLMVIGESTIAGVGVSTHTEGFAGTLANELSERWSANIRWNVYAKSGYTARLVENKILPQIPDDQPDLIVLGLGGNDAFGLRSPAHWANDITSLIAVLRARFGRAPIVFTNMPPIKEFPAFTGLMKFTIGNLVEMFGERLITIAAQSEGVHYSSEVITIDKWAQRLNIEKDVSAFFSDGVHPSRLTYQTWARDLGRFIDDKVKLKL